MISSTRSRLRCPKRNRKGAPCEGSLELEPFVARPLTGLPASVTEVTSGELACTRCSTRYPILSGVALLVTDVESYLYAHAKGVSRIVRDADIPKAYRHAYQEGKAQLREEHIEEDLEASRVTALYVMNHYLSTAGSAAWWKPDTGPGDALLDSLIREHWDRGPLNRIGEWIARMASPSAAVIELGCGVGGLYPRIRNQVGTYLGVDSSFASIALARHLALGMHYPEPVRVPSDLLQGTIARDVRLPTPAAPNGRADFIVGDAEGAPAEAEAWDFAVALNLIDMLEDPARLPRLQATLLRQGGRAVQSCPYIWHAHAAKRLRRLVPDETRDSARAVLALYRKEGLAAEESVEHLPWLFFKHLRQLEIYSVHLFSARRGG